MNRAMKSVTMSRMISRPTTLEFIAEIFDDFIEFHGDRLFKDDKSIVGGIATLDGKPVTVVGVQKGHTIEDNLARNFGSPHPEGYRKALRLMKQAEKFNRPVITFVNTSGAYCGIGAEERGQGDAIARNLIEMADLKVPIICIFIGEGGSGGALALAVADEVWMLENGMYAVLSPEGFASILWRNPSRVEEAAELMKITAQDLIQNKVIDKIIPEPEDGLHNNLKYSTDIIKTELINKLEVLSNKNIEDLLSERYNRFRQFGEYSE